MKNLFGLILDEEGQGTAEYAILMACIVVVVIIAINSLGLAIKGNLENSANQINNI